MQIAGAHSIRMGKLFHRCWRALGLVIWTAAVYSFSGYGDMWAIGPALAVLPGVSCGMGRWFIARVVPRNRASRGPWPHFRCLLRSSVRLPYAHQQGQLYEL